MPPNVVGSKVSIGLDQAIRNKVSREMSERGVDYLLVFFLSKQVVANAAGAM
jgi:hypothetical protein